MHEPSADEPLEARRDVPAEDSPVPAGPATVPMTAQPCQEPNRLVLRVPYKQLTPQIVAASLLGFGVVFVLGWRGGQGRGQLTVFPFILALGALGIAWHWYRQFVLSRVTFDKETGELMLGWRGRRGRRPLSSIVGVQVMQTRKHFATADHGIPAMTMYQLNLILDDPAERRLNVMTTVVQTIRTTAGQIADFLGVPVLESGSAAAAADAPPLANYGIISSPVIVEQGPEVLLIRPRRLAGLRLFYQLVWMFVPLGLLAAHRAVADWLSLVLVVICLAWCALALLVGWLQFLRSQARFDRAQGVMTLTAWGRSREPQPLSSVKAVEVMNGANGNVYELNLLPGDPRQRRINLVRDADAVLVWQTAERLASFLGVPLEDSRRTRTAMSHSGAGEEELNLLEELSRSPLSAGKASIRSPARIVVKGDDVLVFRPRVRFNWVGLILALCSMGAGFYLLWFVWFGPAAGQMAFRQWAGALTFAIWGSLYQLNVLKPLLFYRDRFDRKAGLLTLGWFGLKGKYPLAKILAVQLIPGGLVDKVAGPFRRGGEHVSYQLNLVMSESYEERLNVTNEADLAWTRKAGQHLADFLGVPVLDQIADGD